MRGAVPPTRRAVRPHRRGPERRPVVRGRHGPGRDRHAVRTGHQVPLAGLPPVDPPARTRGGQPGVRPGRHPGHRQAAQARSRGTGRVAAVRAYRRHRPGLGGAERAAPGADRVPPGVRPRPGGPREPAEHRAYPGARLDTAGSAAAMARATHLRQRRLQPADRQRGDGRRVREARRGPDR